MPLQPQILFLFRNKFTIFIFIVIIISSYGQNHSKKSTSVCKSVLLENCTEHNCIANVSVINKCPLNFTDTETKKKCENFVDSDLLNDTFLFIPVTSKLKSTTYWNMYCALCNQEHLEPDNLTFWTLRAYHVREKLNFTSVKVDNLESFESNVDLAVLEKMEVHNDTEHLISKFHGLTRRVVLLRYLSSVLRNFSHESCSSDINDNDIDFLIRNSLGRFAPAPDNFNCTGMQFCSSRKIPQPGSCVYFDPINVPCTKNEFYVEEVDFVYHKGKIIRNDGTKLDLYKYSNLSKPSDVIFLCGRRKDVEEPRSKEMHVIIEYMKYISAFLLFVFLVTKMNKENFKSLPNVILYSYCIASLWVYLYQIFCFTIVDRLILKAYLLFYVHLCHAFWAAIISYEYWYVISLALKAKKPRHEMKRYRYYGAIGWILPALILSAVYLSLTEQDKTASCPIIPHHKNINFTEHLSSLARLLHVALHFVYLAVFLILMPFVAVQGCFFIRLARNTRNIEERSAEKGRKKTNSTTDLDYLFIFTKIAYLMGIHWMLLCVALILSFFVDIGFSIQDVFHVLFACHGGFISLAFAFTKTERKRYRSSYKSFMSRSFRSTQVESLTTDDGLKVNVRK